MCLIILCGVPPGRMFERYSRIIIFFLEQIILKNKRHHLDHLKLVCTNISHSIMTAVRPRSFKSKLQLGLSVFFHRRFGSKRLIQIFSSFGLCAFYSETMKCGCKKVGLQCSSACTNCQGVFCSNVKLNTREEDSYDFDEETTV